MEVGIKDGIVQNAIFHARSAYPHSFRFRWDMPAYGHRRRASILQVSRMGTFGEILGSATLLAACQSRSLANDASDDTLRAILTASRRFRRFDRRT